MNPWRLAYFNLIAGGYSLARRPGQAERDLVAHLLRLPDGADLIEVGSGAGYHARDLLRRVPELKVTACEPALFFRLFSQAAASATGLTTRLTHSPASAEALPFPSGTFDAGLCLFVLWAVERRDLGLQELARVIRPGGTLVLADFAQPAPGERRLKARLPFGHPILSGPEELARLLAPHFSVVETVARPSTLFAACRRSS